MELELRGRLAKKLRLDDVPEPLWEELLEEGYVAEAQSRDELQDLVNVARRRLDLASALSEGRGGHPPPRRPVHNAQEELVPLEFGEYENARAQALSGFVAEVASKMGPTLRWRETLGGRVLSQDEAKAFVGSPATRFMSPAQFKEWSVPLVGHRAEVVPDPTAPPEPETRDGMTSDGMVWLGWPEAIALRIEPPGVTKVVVEVSDASKWRAHEQDQSLCWPGAGTWRLEQTTVYPGSVLDRLRLDALALLDATDNWFEHFHRLDMEAQVVWFLLTGQIPSLRPIAGGVGGYSNSNRLWGGFHNVRVTLNILPWVPVDVVAQAYQRMQREARRLEAQLLVSQEMSREKKAQVVEAEEELRAGLEKKRGARVDAEARRERRKPRERTLRLFRFVEEQSVTEGGRPSWNTLRVRWNKAYPRWTCDSTSRFGRDCRRARVAVAGPAGAQAKWPRELWKVANERRPSNEQAR